MFIPKTILIIHIEFESRGIYNQKVAQPVYKVAYNDRIILRPIFMCEYSSGSSNRLRRSSVKLTFCMPSSPSFNSHLDKNNIEILSCF